MKYEEYITGDNDCISMVSRNRAVHPGGEPMILMNKDQAMALMLKASRKQPRKKPEPQEVTKEQLMLQAAHAMAPVFIGMAWILGAFEGLADPAFTSIISGVCILWGCVEWKMGKCNG